MRMKARERRKQALRRWVRWTPVVAIPMSVLFADAWLQTQDWRRDFELGSLAEQRNALTNALKQHDVAAVSLQDLDRLDYMAARMGLVKPEPAQIVAINAEELPVVADSFAVASTRFADAPAVIPSTPVKAPPVALSTLEDIPEGTPVPGMGLVMLEMADVDIEAELLEFSDDTPDAGQFGGGSEG